MNEPLVSIIIPTHNNETTIKRAVESVLNQSYKNVEVIVIDDFSSDKTSEVVSSIKDPRVRLIKNEINLKAGLSRNVGMDNAKGEYIGFLDGDDIYTTCKIEDNLKFLNEHPEFTGVFGLVVPMSEKDKPIDRINFKYKPLTMKSLLTKPVNIAVLMKTPITTRFADNFNVAEDFFFWCRCLIDKYTFARTDYVGYYYNMAYENRMTLSYKKQFHNELFIINYCYKNKQINWLQKVYFKLLYFAKFLRRPIKFKYIAWKEKKKLKNK